MSSLNSLYIKKETLETLLKGVTQKGDKGIELTVVINDELNAYGQNISAWVSQSKEQREAKKPRFFVGNGKTFWPKMEEVTPADDLPDNGDDLPF